MSDGASEMVQVAVEHLVKAESARMFDGIMCNTVGVNVWTRHREPVPLDEQNVIRMNRDTLYSSVTADISEGLTVTLPDAGGAATSP